MILSARFLTVCASALLLAGCSSLFAERTAEMVVTTNPPGAKCTLVGADGFTRDVVTPARLVMPVAASPVDVTCLRPGYHAAYGRMEISDRNWVMRNGGSTLAGLGAEGLSMVGLDVGDPNAVDPNANKVTVPLPPVTPRPVLLRQRGSQGETRVDP